MEDLLREAGYKETRVFTPEAERFPADGDKRREDTEGLSVKESVGAVVGFLAGLVPGHSKQNVVSADLASDNQEVCSGRPHPPSPLARKVEQSPSATSSLRSRKFTIAPQNQRPTSGDFETSSGSSGDPPQNHAILGDANPISDRQSLRSQPSASKLQTSRAYNYLRHMASTPSMQRRSSKDSAASAVDLTEPVPPLPIAWRENVIAAMNMKGSISTGGLTERNRALSRPKSTRTLRVRDNRKNPYEQEDERRGRTVTREQSSLAPPQIRTPRLASPGTVAKINVMCKSAPGSRSASVVRGTFTGGFLDVSQLDRAFRDKGKGVRRPSKRIRSQVPSLVVTGVEGDDWGGTSSDGVDASFHQKQELDYDEDDEDEGEVDLAKMLLHPKRQQSIQSLRQHLQRHTSASQLRKQSGAREMEHWVLDEDTESDYASHRRGSTRDKSSWSRRSARRRDRVPNDWEEE